MSDIDCVISFQRHCSTSIAAGIRSNPELPIPKHAEPEDDEPEADPPMTEEDEMEQEFMSDAHDDYPEGFMDRE